MQSFSGPVAIEDNFVAKDKNTMEETKESTFNTENDKNGGEVEGENSNDEQLDAETLQKIWRDAEENEAENEVNVEVYEETKD